MCILKDGAHTHSSLLKARSPQYLFSPTFLAMAPGYYDKWYRGEPVEEAGPNHRLGVHRGPDGFGDDLEELRNLFGELQRSSADIANPDLDLLTFASSAQYFGVLTRDEILSKQKVSRAREAKANHIALLASAQLQRMMVESEKKRAASGIQQFRYDIESWASTSDDDGASTIAYCPDKVKDEGSSRRPRTRHLVFVVYARVASSFCE